MRKFEVNNINCQKCANLIKNSLEDNFGQIQIDMSINPKILKINIDDKKLVEFKEELHQLGFEIVQEV